MMSSDGLAALKIDRSRRRRRVSPWVGVVLVVVFAGAVLSPRLMRGLQVAEVGVAPAVRISAATGDAADGSPELTAAGYVVADRQSVLAAKFTGRLAKLNVAEAEFVKQGDIVAELDHSELDATIAQAEAEVAEAAAEVQRLARLADQAEAELAAAEAPLQTLAAENKQYEILLADAQRRLERDEKLAASSAVGASEVDDRRTEVLATDAKIAWTLQRQREAERRIAVVQAQTAAARAAVASAEARQQTAAARVKVLESQREESFIRSPFDGMVTEKAAEVGEIVAPISIGGSMARGSIVTIADWASLQAEVDVAEAQLGRVKPGQRAAITVDAIPGQGLSRQGAPDPAPRGSQQGDGESARGFPGPRRAGGPARDGRARPVPGGQRAARRRNRRGPGQDRRAPGGRPVGPGRQFRVGRQRGRGPQAGRPGRGEFRPADRDHQRRQRGGQGRGARCGAAERDRRCGSRSSRGRPRGTRLRRSREADWIAFWKRYDGLRFPA